MLGFTYTLQDVKQDIENCQFDIPQIKALKDAKFDFRHEFNDLEDVSKSVLVGDCNLDLYVVNKILETNDIGYIIFECTRLRDNEVVKVIHTNVLPAKEHYQAIDELEESFGDLVVHFYLTLDE